MGRDSKPTALKVVGGNPGKRALNHAEPDPQYLDDLTPPAHLSPEAAAVWTELAKPLRDSRLLTVLDKPALEMAANSIAMYRLASSNCITAPLARSPETGAVALSPWAIVQSMAQKHASAMLKEFGMTPSARSKVMINPQQGLFDPLSEFQQSAPKRA